MADIQILPQELADKIAAGEVAERPSAVVKELAENSIDAGATAIEVEIRKGGIEYIRVTDNGCGIAPEQTELAFLRHATSKLKSVDDLYKIGTMGFRGEALASICAVAEVELITKTADNEEGRFVRTEHGKICENTPIGCADGTVMVVQNLFENIPARMKFLKKNSTEAGYVADILSRIALSRPDIAIDYICDDKEIFSTTGDGKLKNVILKLYGVDHAKAVIPIDYTENNVRITGVIGKPELARGNRSRQTLFVNGRYIKSNAASKVVAEGYRNAIMKGKFPFFVLNIHIAPECVDVNVHPAKTEIKFANENRVYEILYHAVSNGVRGGSVHEYSNIADNAQPHVTDSGINPNNLPRVGETSVTHTYSGGSSRGRCERESVDRKLVGQYLDRVIPTKQESEKLNAARDMIYSDFNFLDEDEPKAPETPTVQADFERRDDGFDGEKADIYEMRKSEPMQEPNGTVLSVNDSVRGDNFTDNGFQTESSPQESMQDIENIGEIENAEKAEKPKPIGQVFDTYVLCAQGDSFWMIDQHAAHERARFEKLKADYYSKERMSQVLMSPIILKLDYNEVQTVLSNLNEYKKFGFDIEDFGSGSIIINATPIISAESEIRDLVLEIAAALENTGRHSVAEFEESLLDMIACKYAIKANRHLNYAEMQEVIDIVIRLAESGITTCPHGRPIKIELTKTEIEKMFKRRV